MLKKMPKDETPEGRSRPSLPTSEHSSVTRPRRSPITWLKTFARKKHDNTNNIQEALDDLIEELKDSDDDQTVVNSQKMLITNVLKSHDLRVSDVMVPRSDIIAVEDDTTLDELKEVFKGNQFSRIPVYKGTLDNIIGVLHIKDLLLCLLEKRECTISNLIRDVTIVSPGVPLMDLFLNLREGKKHMALVVDEHGGIDGLVTINDIVEAVMGDIEDEFDNDDQPQIIEKADGSLVVDARFEVDDFEERYGAFLTAEEREEVETLGGLAFFLAGHVPKKGEVFKHSCGMVLEIMDANASRVNRIRIRNLPQSSDASDEV